MLKGEIRKQFEGKVIVLVDIVVVNLWGHFKDGVLRASDKTCWMMFMEKQRRHVVVECTGEGGNIKKEGIIVDPGN